MNIRDRIKVETKDYPLYNIRYDQYKQAENSIPFRVSSQPFGLTKSQTKELDDIGKAICGYMDFVIELYNEDDGVRALLNRGKPHIFCEKERPKYLFLRPDLILTKDGFSICEIETSPFGLALAEILNNAYGNEKFETIVEQNKLKNYVSSQLQDSGTIAYSDKVSAFKGQMKFLADQVFSSGDKKWTSKLIDGQKLDEGEIYRAFYLSEFFTDENVKNLLEEARKFTPTLTPQFEEKALLSFIWDKRYIEFFKNRLGGATYQYLKKIIPPTWIVRTRRSL